MHKTRSVDYGILLSGERVMELDDCTLTLRPGDVVIDVGAWHLWDSSKTGCLMAFDMFDAEFADGPAGTAQGNDKPLRAPDNQQLPPGVKPQRRVVAIDREAGKSSLVGDTASPDVRIDPARPGFALHRMWVVDGFPAKLVFETLHLPNVLAPPRNGSVLNVFTFPPDAAWKGKAGEREVEGVLPGGGSAGRVGLVGSGAAPVHAEDAHPRSLCSCSKARSSSCSTRRKSRCGPGRSSSSAGRTTRGAIDRGSLRSLPSRRTTRRDRKNGRFT